jgi:carbonic anhydrase
VKGDLVDRPCGDHVQACAAAQYPVAAVLGCIDSRVPVEAVFDQGIGDLCVARVAGNVVNDDILGSLEFACEVLGARAVIVLGHTNCGAIDGAISGAELGNLGGVIKKIEPAIRTARRRLDPAEPAFSGVVCEANVKSGLASIRRRSPLLAAKEKARDIVIEGAVYDVSTGLVRFFSGSSA